MKNDEERTKNDHGIVTEMLRKHLDLVFSSSFSFFSLISVKISQYMMLDPSPQTPHAYL